MSFAPTGTDALAWAAVTGASSGIGEAFAHELSAQGYGVLLIARDRDALEAVAAALSGPAEVLAADLSAADDVARVESRLRVHPVQLLVNNAATGWWGPFAEPSAPVDGHVQDDPDPLDDAVAVNVLAAARLARAVLPGLLAADRGGIVTVSSPAAAQPAPMLAVYAASKAFTDALDASLRAELDETGVTVTTVWPSWTRTHFHARLDQDVSRVPDEEWNTPDAVARRALDAHLRGEATIRIPELTRRERTTEQARALRRNLPGPVKAVGRRARASLAALR